MLKRVARVRALGSRLSEPVVPLLHLLRSKSWYDRNHVVTSPAIQLGIARRTADFLNSHLTSRANKSCICLIDNINKL